MAVGCSENCMKYILFFFNLIIFVLGIAGVALGVILLVKKDFLLEGLEDIDSDVLDGFSNSTIKGGAIILIISSVVVILISFFGCYGAWKESSCMLGTYSTIMGVLLVLQAAVFIMVIIAQPKLEVSVKKALEEMLSTANTDEKKKAVAELFEKNKCCGVNGANDTIPFGIKCNEAYKGCYEKIEDGIKRNLPGAIGIAIAIILVQLFLIVFACCLCSSKRGETLS